VRDQKDLLDAGQIQGVTVSVMAFDFTQVLVS
jgi:hypothetical protein